MKVDRIRPTTIKYKFKVKDIITIALISLNLLIAIWTYLISNENVYVLKYNEALKMLMSNNELIRYGALNTLAQLVEENDKDKYAICRFLEGYIKIESKNKTKSDANSGYDFKLAIEKYIELSTSLNLKVNFANVSFKGTEFENVGPIEESYCYNINLDSCLWRNTVMRETCFKNSYICNNEFHNCELDGSDFRESIVRNNLFDRCNCSGTFWGEIGSEKILCFEDCTFCNYDLINVSFANMIQKNITFHNINNLSNINYINCDLYNIIYNCIQGNKLIFRDCNAYNIILSEISSGLSDLSFCNFSGERMVISFAQLKNMSLYNTTLRDSKFENNTTLIGITGNNVTFLNVNMEYCRIEGGVIYDLIVKGGNWTGSELINSDLTNAVFRNVTLDNTSFEGTDLRGASFINCKISNINLKNCIIDSNTKLSSRIIEKYKNSIKNI